MASAELVYDLMVGLVNEPSILDDVTMVDDTGTPILPKLPVFVIDREYDEWLCCWYFVRQWSPAFDANPMERERILVTAMAWTAKEFGVG